MPDVGRRPLPPPSAPASATSPFRATPSVHGLDPRDGRWIATGAPVALAAEDGFLPPSADDELALVRLDALRVDGFDPSSLATVSGRVVVARSRIEEFRIEGLTRDSPLEPGAHARLGGVATTQARRICYLVAFEAAPDGRWGRLRLQRLQLRPQFGTPVSEAIADAALQAGRVFEIACARDDDRAFRRLHLAFRIDPSLADAPHVDAALGAFGCGAELGLRLVPPRPRRLDDGRPTMESALARAGIGVAASTGTALRPGAAGERLRETTRNALAAGSDDAEAVRELLAWAPRDVDAVVQGAIDDGTSAGLPDRWSAAVVLVPRFAERPHVVGTMLGTSQRPRTGCAVFVEPSGSDAWTMGERTRAVRFTAVHEIGHLLNLLHAFEAEKTAHLHQPSRPQAATFMNYPNRFPFGVAVPPATEGACRALFWQRFEDRFGTDELHHLRHGWEAGVRPGGWVESLIGSDAGCRSGDHGLDELAAGAFTYEGLAGLDGDLLKALATPLDPRSGLEGVLIARVHLPAELVLGEPLVGWLEITNASSMAQLVPAELDPASGQVRIELQREGGEAVAFEPARLDCGAGLGRLEPGCSLTQPLQLSYGRHCYVTEPGRYRITVRVGDLLATSSDVRVGAPAVEAARLLDVLFADERTGLALLGETAPGVRDGDVAHVIAQRGLAPPALAGAIDRYRAGAKLQVADRPDEIERVAHELLRVTLRDARAVGGGLRWRQHVRELHALALALLRADDLAPGVGAKLAGRAARSSLALVGKRSPELATSRTARAILRVAGSLAGGSTEARSSHTND